jgi:hypothetical protein
MNCCLEFHDSRAGSVTSADGTVKLALTSAYIHKSEGIPGVDAGTGWTQAAILEFSAASIAESHDVGDGWIIDGLLEVNRGHALSCIPVPLDVSGMVKATFGFSNGLVLVIEAARAHLALSGNPSFVETFTPE